MHYQACITIGTLETDPQDSRRKRINYNKGRTLVKWYRADGIGAAMTLAGKTKFAKVKSIREVSYTEYVEGVEKHHEY